MDFTFDTHTILLESLLRQGFSFCTLNSYVSAAPAAAEKTIVLRHDVEEKYEHALRFARIQHALGIQGSYYFRILPKPQNEGIIREIASLGHETGYHYDDLSECHGNYAKAIARFEQNLNYLRQFGPVTTMTMEGAPRSKYDNRNLWLGRIDERGREMERWGEWENKSTNQQRKNQQMEKGRMGEGGILSLSHPIMVQYKQLIVRNPNLPRFDYHDFGITAEPYFDLDFNKIFYLTDTGRRWDGWKVSVRDKVPQQEVWKHEGLVFRSTPDIIRAAETGRLPHHIMFTFHPQRWNANPLPWLKELVFQRIKNTIKYGIVCFSGPGVETIESFNS